MNHSIIFGQINESLGHYLSTSKHSQLVILCDDNTHKHCYPKLTNLPNHKTLVIPAGEHHKSIYACEVLWEQFLDHGIDRHALLINLGGGVTTDLGGFVASCYKRGIAFLNIPTSLLAMVDASTGGKTGINFGEIKNSIGIFNAPKTVLIDQEFLKTLPERHVTNGIAEILKHGFIADQQHVSQLHQAATTNNWEPLIRKSVAIKQTIVENDPFEQGERKALNFGHTIGHAIESYSVKHDDSPLLHGEAIAMGMVAEAWLSKKYCALSEQDYQWVVDQIKRYFSIQSFSTQQISTMISLMKNDKKNESNKILMSLLKEIGKPMVNIDVTELDCTESLEQLKNEV